MLRNAENQRQRDRLAEVTHAKHRYADELQRLDERIEALQAQRRELKASYDAAVVAEEAATKTVAQLQDESTAALEESIRNVEDTNRKVRANLDKARAEDDAAEMAAQYSKLTDQINEARRKRTALLDGADLPLPGLGVEDGCLTYHGKRWRDMSGSDQLRVATAIVRRLNPNCGFVLLDKLEQMDLATLAEFGRCWKQRVCRPSPRGSRPAASARSSSRMGGSKRIPQLVTRCYKLPQTPPPGRKEPFK